MASLFSKEITSEIALKVEIYVNENPTFFKNAPIKKTTAFTI